MPRFKDLTGQKFGALTAQWPIGKKDNNVMWLCLCECGELVATKQGSLRYQSRQSCGCRQSKMGLKNGRVVDIVGRRFGRLTILSHSHVQDVGTKGRQAYSNAICDCGKQITVCNTRVRRGTTRSCGCLQIESRIREGAAQRELYGKYKKRALQKGSEFPLGFEEFIKFVQQDCFYCGAVPSQVITNSSGSEKFLYNGIDRWDNNVGYLIGNMTPCCGDCNRQKLTQSGEEFIARCQTIVSRMEKILREGRTQTCAV